MVHTGRHEPFATGAPALPPAAVAPVETAAASDIERARTVARLLDHYMVDPLLGLILPGGGDLIGSLLGLYVVAIAVRRKMSPVIISRMLLNLALDAGLGLVPLVGDLADFAFRANRRNLALLTERQTTGRATARDWLAVAGAAALFLAILGAIVYAFVAVIRAIAG